MASTSSSASNSQYYPQWKYVVFLSFRGEDTRKTFTGHLYEGLKNRGIFTFQDDKRLEHGESISEELLKAIEESQVALIIFSKNYATSSWCLNELVKIMECKDKNRQTVIPIFYDVDPSHVQKQTESFADAFAKHELKCKGDYEGLQKVQEWRTALTAAANLKGYDIRNKIESETIQEIVDHVSKSFKSVYSLSSSQDFVGINIHLEKAKSLLEIERNDDVRIIGIWGMGGVGKTTIARAIFDNLSWQFQAACLLENVKEIAKKNQLFSLQNILLSRLLGKKDDYVDSNYEGKQMISRRLGSMKVLIVLDDIDHSDHLEYLAGDVGWFGHGSRVVVTTRDKRLIDMGDAITYEVTPLADLEAMQLFKQHAFRGEVPDEFKNLSLEVVNYAKGLPLALKLWGSMLYKRDRDEWTSIMQEMRNNSDSDIDKNLRISYDGLKDGEQTVFLDIACFFRGDGKKEVMQILESCHLRAVNKLSILIEKSLLFISEDDTIEMHDLIQDMGKNIVKMQKDAGKCSRLWDSKDFEDVMVKNTGTKAMEAIWLQGIPHLCFRKKAMKRMKRLRILSIHGNSDIEYLPKSLCWFQWHWYPRESLPEIFEPNNSLVHLDFWSSSLRHLWTGTKHFPCLRTLRLSWCKSLMRTPDFREMPNLEYLRFYGCESLEEVDDSLRYCGKLIRLNLNRCSSLKRFPCVNVESLEILDLMSCRSLEKFPEIKGRSKLGLKIWVTFSGIRELPSSFFQHQTHLTKLDLSFMKYLVSLPSSIGVLNSLVELDVHCCSKLESLPQEIGDLENLEKLDARYTQISRPPSSIARLNNLKFLRFNKEISIIRLQDVVCFVFPSVNDGLRSLEDLDLSFCNLIDGGLPEDIGCLSSLKKLNLNGNNFKHLPQSIAQLGAPPSCIGMLKSLVELDVSECSSLEILPEEIGDLENLEKLYAGGTLISRPPSSIDRLNKLKSLSFAKNKSEVGLQDGVSFVFPRVNDGLRSLEDLDLSYCNLIDGGLPEDIGCLSSLKKLNLNGNNFEHLPRSIAQLGALRLLSLSHCLNLKEFPQVNDGFRSLEDLDLSYCNLIDEGLLEDIGSLSFLKKLNLNGNNFEHLPRSIAVVALQSLELSDCKRLKEFPQVNDRLCLLEDLDLSYCSLIDGGLLEDIGSLSSLKKLNLNGNHFEHLPRSIAQFAALQSLELSDCKRLKELPEFPQQLDRIDADWSNDWICNSLFQNISSLSLRVFTSTMQSIPSWFDHQGTGRSVSVNLPENWYVPNKFLGFAVCYSDSLLETTAQLIPLCDDGMSWMTQKLTLFNDSIYYTESIHFFLVPFAGLWDASKINGKTPNDYGLIRLSFSREMEEFGLRLLYKDEPDVEALLQMRKNNNELTERCIMTRRSRYDDCEASSSSCKKQRSHYNISGSSVFQNLQ